jgi:AcrR family transcriptional regulator
VELLAAATQLLISRQGLSLPSLRSIAQAAGVTPGAVYLQFESQSDLVNAVVEAQLAMLRETVERAHARGSDPRRKLRAAATAYVSWGLEHPGAYQLIFESADGMSIDVAAAESGGAILEFLMQSVKDCGIDRRSVGKVAMRTWASLHGLVSLHIHKPGAPWVTTPEVDAAAVVSLMVGDGRATSRAPGPRSTP